MYFKLNPNTMPKRKKGKLPTSSVPTATPQKIEI